MQLNIYNIPAMFVDGYWQVFEIIYNVIVKLGYPVLK